MAIKLQIRRGLAADWALSNPTLLDGEMGVESDTGNTKVGNGTNAWNDLAYQFPYLTGNSNDNPEDTTTLVVDQTNDRVGIGTSSPASLLHVNGTAPVIRMSDSGGSGYSELNADNASGSLVISTDVANLMSGSAIGFNVDNTRRVTIEENGRVGIGTTAPSVPLHVSTADPQIRLADSDVSSTIYGQIGSGPAGEIVIASDPGNAAASSGVTLSVDGTARIEATTTGATVTGTLTAGTFSGSGSGLTSSTVPHAALANDTGPIVIGRQTATSGSLSALSMATLKTMLGGIGTAAAQNTTDFMPDPQTGAGIGQIFAWSSDTGSVTVGSVSQTWAIWWFGFLQNTARSVNGTASGVLVITGTQVVTTGSSAYGNAVFAIGIRIA